MKFKVTKIAAAVVAGLGVSVVGMNAAQADSILFPYVVTGGAITTLMSVINAANTGTAPPAAQASLHYRFWHKGSPAPTATTNTIDPCSEVDYFAPSSTNDIVTFDIGSVFATPAQASVLFEPNTAPGAPPHTPNYIINLAPFTTIKPAIGFAVVDNGTTSTPSLIGDTLGGEAFIVDFTTGSVWGYDAYNAASIWSATATVPPAIPTLTLENPADFSDRVETKGEVIVGRPAGAPTADYWVRMAVMPFSQVTTRLFVTPIAWAAGADPTHPYQLKGNINARVGLRGDTTNVIFDRDENGISGLSEQQVRCVGRLDVAPGPGGDASMLAAAVVARAPMGGWTHVAVGTGAGVLPPVVGTASTVTDQAVVMKLEFNPSATSTLNGVAVNGSFNNGIWLRKGIRESLNSTGLAVDGWPVGYYGRPLVWPPTVGAPIALATTATTSSYLPTYNLAGLAENNSPAPLLITGSALPDRVPAGIATPLSASRMAGGAFWSTITTTTNTVVTPATVQTATTTPGKVTEKSNF
jgi:hypothetical protein